MEICQNFDMIRNISGMGITYWCFKISIFGQTLLATTPTSQSADPPLTLKFVL